MAGLLVLEDAVRTEAKQLTEKLKRLGVRVVLVTGDNEATAQRIADELGIPEVHAEVLPAEKVEIVKMLQAQGRMVAFVGDGVNDGPVLATADVGVAMGVAGTDVAIETAEIALLSDDLGKLPHLLELSRQAIRAIKQNLVFSLGVLGIAVGLAIPGILHPWFASPSGTPHSSRSVADPAARWAAHQPHRPGTRARAGSVSVSSRATPRNS